MNFSSGSDNNCNESLSLPNSRRVLLVNALLIYSFITALVQVMNKSHVPLINKTYVYVSI